MNALMFRGELDCCLRRWLMNPITSTISDNAGSYTDTQLRTYMAGAWIKLSSRTGLWWCLSSLRSPFQDSTFSYLQLILSLSLFFVVVVVISPPPDVLLIDFRLLLHFQGEMAKLLLVTPPLTLSAVVSCRVVSCSGLAVNGGGWPAGAA